MDTPSTKAESIAKAIGFVFIILAVTCMAIFVNNAGGTLARYGLPRAWSGGPPLLGAGFFGISGAFLLAQKRFSLSGILVALLAAAALTAGMQAYVMNEREISTIRTEFLLPAERHAEFIQLCKEFLSTTRLEEVVRAANKDGWLTGPDILASSGQSYASNPADKDIIVSKLEFRYSKILYPYGVGEESFESLYTELVQNWIVRKLVDRDQYSSPGADTNRTLNYLHWSVGGRNSDAAIGCV